MELPLVVGSVFIMDGRPITIVGIGPRGFFGETLRSDPPDLWVPLHQEPVLVAGNSLLRRSSSAWLRVLGRAKPGAALAPVAPRLTARRPADAKLDQSAASRLRLRVGSSRDPEHQRAVCLVSATETGCGISRTPVPVAGDSRRSTRGAGAVYAAEWQLGRNRDPAGPRPIEKR